MRPAFDALFDIDDAMGAVVASATQPALAAIKLAWWRERLQELDDVKVPAEPRLQAAARELLPRGISGAQLSQLEPGWAVLLQEMPDPDETLERGVRLFEMAAQLLDVSPPDYLRIGGRIYVAGQLTRCRMAPDGLGFVVGGPRIPMRFRRLTGMAVLARRDLWRAPDLEPEATPGRAWALLRHWLTGRY